MAKTALWKGLELTSGPARREPCSPQARMQRRNSMLLDRFQVGQDRCDFIGLEDKFWHVGTADGDSLCQRLGQRLNGIPGR